LHEIGSESQMVNVAFLEKTKLFQGKKLQPVCTLARG